MTRWDRVRQAARSAGRSGGGVIGVVGILLVWELGAHLLAGRHILPTPYQVAVEMWNDKSYYWPNMLVTLREAGKGYVAGNVLAIVLGVAFVQVPVLERLFMRLAIASYCVPLVAIAPILIVVTSGDTPKAALAAIAVFFTTLIATLLGLRSVDKSALDLAKSCGGSSWLTLRKIRFQAALPSIFAGLRIAAPSALLGAIIGEYLGTNSGLGAILIQSQTSFNVTETWGLAVFIAALAGVAYALTSLVARLLLPWAAKGSTVVIGTADRRAAGQSLVSRTGVALAYVVASVALIIGLWYGVIWVLNLNDFFAKNPADVWNYLFTGPNASPDRALVFGQLGETINDAVLGYVAGTIVAVLVAIGIVAKRSIEQTLMPIAIALRSVPLVAMTPFLMLIFGRGAVGVSVVVGIVVFFPTLVNMIIGMRTAPEQAIDMVASYGGSTLRAIRSVRFPYALPALFASARIAVPAAVAGATLAEWLATGRGLGNLIVVSYANSEFNTLWSATVVLVVVAVSVYALVGMLETVVRSRFGPAPEAD
jgi:ABC-type nitrate/sulfonate/bicarbonate transport system permease component